MPETPHEKLANTTNLNISRLIVIYNALILIFLQHSRTALHTAVDENEGINIIALILSHGVNINARDSVRSCILTY